MCPGELTHKTAPLNAAFEAVSEHRWEETSVVAQPLPVHPSHDLPTLFFCRGSSLWGSLCRIRSAAFFVGGRGKRISPERFPWGVLGLKGQQRSYQALNWALQELRKQVKSRADCVNVNYIPQALTEVYCQSLSQRKCPQRFGHIQAIRFVDLRCSRECVK